MFGHVQPEAVASATFPFRQNHSEHTANVNSFVDKNWSSTIAACDKVNQQPLVDEIRRVVKQYN